MHIPDTLHGFSFVSPPASAALIAAVEQSTADRRAGIFGPTSLSWKINRESALFLGAGRAALLQLAHPWVATALQQHSSLMADPIARFHHTFRIVFTMIFGSLDQATAAARHLYTLHTYIQGSMEEDAGVYARGSHYEANEIGALLWVYATLVESAVLAYECVLPALTQGELEQYYAESKTLAALFGLPSAVLPHNWKAFLEYCRAMESGSALEVTAAARTMAHSLMLGAGSWLRPPRWYRALTTAWLPARFRTEFALTIYEDERRVEAARKWLPRIYTKLPARLRFVGPWHEANERQQNRAPSVLTRASNCFWTGDARLPFEKMERT